MKVEQLSLFDMPAVDIAPSACLSVKAFAKVLNSKGYDIGEKRLFEKMRNVKLIDKWNVPYQKYMNVYFKVIRETYYKGEIPNVYLKVLLTPKGQNFIEEFIKNENACDRT